VTFADCRIRTPASSPLCTRSTLHCRQLPLRRDAAESMGVPGHHHTPRGGWGGRGKKCARTTVVVPPWLVVRSRGFLLSPCGCCALFLPNTTLGRRSALNQCQRCKGGVLLRRLHCTPLNSTYDGGRTYNYAMDAQSWHYWRCSCGNGSYIVLAGTGRDSRSEASIIRHDEM
jgi:hypothetical protein